MYICKLMCLLALEFLVRIKENETLSSYTTGDYAGGNW